MYVLLIVVCPFVRFLLAIVLSVLLRYTDSDCPFGIFKLCSIKYVLYVGSTVQVIGNCLLIRDKQFKKKTKKNDAQMIYFPRFLRVVNCFHFLLYRLNCYSPLIL